MVHLIRKALKLCRRELGVTISSYPLPDSYKRCLRDYLYQMRINVVLDVGAYIGDYARELREIGYRGQIVSFEPTPASYQQLLVGMQGDTRWCSKPFGLSDEDRDAVFNTHREGNFNSLLTMREDIERAYSLDHSLWDQTRIQLRRLDAVLPEVVERIPSPRIFMKLDTQGHDLSVVKGASGVLNMVVGLQSELPAVEMYEGVVSISDALKFYAGCGFVPIGFYPVNTFRDVQISPEFDVLFNRYEGRLGHS